MKSTTRARARAMAVAVAIPGLIGLSGTGCGIPTDSPVMRPGDNCLRCHSGERAQAWTVAGTLFASPTATTDMGVEGASVFVTDANGKTLTLHTNGAGNFYTAEDLVFPLRIQAQRGSTQVGMLMRAPDGACNSCHTDPPANGAPGRIYVP